MWYATQFVLQFGWVTVIHGVNGCAMISVRRTVVSVLLQCGWVTVIRGVAGCAMIIVRRTVVAAIRVAYSSA